MTVVATSLTSLSPFVGLPASQHVGLFADLPPEAGCVVAIPDVETVESVATLTNEGLHQLARSAALGVAFRLNAFRLGPGGFNPTRFSQPIPVTSATQLSSVRYEGAISRIDSASTDGTIYSYTCYLPRELRGVFGEVGLVAEILDSPVPADIGTKFVYAIGHFPAISKHNNSAVTLRILLRG